MKKLFMLLLLTSIIPSLGHAFKTEYDQKLDYYQHFPEGETICAYGAPYSFFQKKGKVKKLIIDFLGGGACWSETSCRRGAFRNNLDGMKNAYKNAHGIYKKDIKENTLKDWHHVTVGYCTGDLHWGDTVKTFGEGEKALTLNFKGAVNAKTVLEWIYKEYKELDEIFVTGTSAGSYASIYWLPYIRRNYPKEKTRIIQMGDAGSGIVTNQFLEESLENWNARKYLPNFVPGLDDLMDDPRKASMFDIYRLAAKTYPEVSFSQTGFAYDQGSIFFLELMGSETDVEIEDFDQFYFDELTKGMESLRDIPNFSYYISPGEQHTIIDNANFYTMESNGVKMVDWFAKLMGEKNPGGVLCQECEEKDW